MAAAAAARAAAAEAEQAAALLRQQLMRQQASACLGCIDCGKWVAGRGQAWREQGTPLGESKLLPPPAVMAESPSGNSHHHLFPTHPRPCSQGMLEAAAQREAAAAWREGEAREAARQAEQRAAGAEACSAQLGARLVRQEDEAAAEAERLRQLLSEARAGEERASQLAAQLRQEFQDAQRKLVSGA